MSDDPQPPCRSRLNERDLLRQCVDQPKYLSKALGHDSAAESGLESKEQKKEFLKYLYKAWSGMTKYIYQQCAVNSKCVDFPLVGRFFYRSTGDAEKLKFTYIPHLDFIDSGRFSFP